jgi:hypothetical protein
MEGRTKTGDIDNICGGRFGGPSLFGPAVRISPNPPRPRASLLAHSGFLTFSQSGERPER